VLYGEEYWNEVLDFKPFAEWGAIAEADLSLLRYANSPQEAFTLLRDHLATHHLEPVTAPEKPAPELAATRS